MKSYLRRAGMGVRLGLLFAAAMTSGCGTFKLFSCSSCDTPPTGLVCQLAARWEPTVAETLDPANGGAPLRGIAGRVYLYDVDGKQTLDGCGDVIVDLYDDRLVPAGGMPKHLERWVFPADVIKQLQRKDAVGWGYTMFLPWSTAHPDINRVHVRACYQAPARAPVYAASPTMALNHSDRPVFMHASRQELGNGTPVRTPSAVMPQQHPQGFQQAGAQIPAAQKAQPHAQLLPPGTPQVQPQPQPQPGSPQVPTQVMRQPIAVPQPPPNQPGGQQAIVSERISPADVQRAFGRTGAPGQPVDLSGLNASPVVTMTPRTPPPTNYQPATNAPAVQPGVAKGG